MFKRKTLNKLALAVVLAIPFWDMILAYVTTPIRCDMWKNKRLDISLKKDEWSIMGGGDQISLKDTRWIYYSKLFSDNDEMEKERKLFIYKNSLLYKESLMFENNEFWLSSLNSKYPNLGIYIHRNVKGFLGHDIIILYDNKLDRVIVKYNYIYGYYQVPFFNSNAGVYCSGESEKDFTKNRIFIQNYLN
ncbi:hypothetical protein BMT54_08845 [Pasteurellaceae bacterium 15-036681]|nr:hypothetical protein BMT54_08845 [Pasteurellaceae bacterium 15-036681]